MSILKAKSIVLKIIITLLMAVVSVGTAVFCNNVYHDIIEVQGAVVTPDIGDSQINFWSTGDGTASSPYEIRNYSDMVKLSLLDSSDIRRQKNYVLVNDIEENEYADEFIDGNLGRFYGTLDGQGHTLSNFVFMEQDYDDTSVWGTLIGLFSYIEGATIANLKMQNTLISVSPYDHIELNLHDQMHGAIAGYAVNSTINNCSIDGLEIEMEDDDNLPLRR